MSYSNEHINTLIELRTVIKKHMEELKELYNKDPYNDLHIMWVFNHVCESYEEMKTALHSLDDFISSRMLKIFKIKKKILLSNDSDEQVVIQTFLDLDKKVYNAWINFYSSQNDPRQAHITGTFEDIKNIRKRAAKLFPELNQMKEL